MKTIQLRRCDTKELVDFAYDETLPCVICGNPVVNASCGGVNICPSCDCGYWRTGKKIDIRTDAIWLLTGYYHLRPEVPTFQEVHLIASLLAARGVHVGNYELSCVFDLHIQEPWFIYSPYAHELYALTKSYWQTRRFELPDDNNDNKERS